VREEQHMSKPLRQILVAIRELSHAPKSELHKAAALARASGASLELFHVIDSPDPGVSWPETATAGTITAQREQIASRCRRRLEQYARDGSLRGLRVTCTTSWDYPPHEAIIRRARSSRAGLVMALTRPHRPGARLVLRNTDWELIRHCPVPLLLVKSGRPYRNPAVLAAVDPFHARPADLDARLLAAGGALARLLHGSLHVFHSYMPLVSLATMPTSTVPLATLPPEVEEAHGRQIARAIDKLAESADVPRARRHIHMGDVTGELRAAVGDTHAGVVVMGAVSRSGLARLFIGNTAERVLDKLDCDILVVKPRSFRTKVERRPAVSAPRSTGRARAARVGRHPHPAPPSTVTTMRVMLPPV
jgi:universal stress protein E